MEKPFDLIAEFALPYFCCSAELDAVRYKNPEKGAKMKEEDSSEREMGFNMISVPTKI